MPGLPDEQQLDPEAHEVPDDFDPDDPLEASEEVEAELEDFETDTETAEDDDGEVSLPDDDLDEADPITEGLDDEEDAAE